MFLIFEGKVDLVGTLHILPEASITFNDDLYINDKAILINEGTLTLESNSSSITLHPNGIIVSTGELVNKGTFITLSGFNT